MTGDSWICHNATHLSHLSFISKSKSIRPSAWILGVEELAEWRFSKSKMRSRQRWSSLNRLPKHCALATGGWNINCNGLTEADWLYFSDLKKKQRAMKYSRRPFIFERALGETELPMTNESFMAVPATGAVFKDAPRGFSKGMGLNHLMLQARTSKGRHMRHFFFFLLVTFISEL